MATAPIFISSVQKELAEERRTVKAFIEGDSLLRRYFTVFLFEDLPASDRRADAVYLDEVQTQRRLTNTVYQKLTGASRPTAKRDLEDLVQKGVLSRTGAGRSAGYEVSRKRLRNGSISSGGSTPSNGS